MSVIRRLHVPLRWPEEVIAHLGAPHHWKVGRSAQSLVEQWWRSNELPAGVRCLLDSADEWIGAELIDAFAERKTDLADGRSSHSQSDLLAILGINDRLGIVVIEAKVDEGFDRTVDEWCSVEEPGKIKRLAKLCDLLELDRVAVAPLRYQLLHRTAAAIYEARRFRSRQAAMIVQSWCPANNGRDDFLRFVDALGLTINAGALSDAKIVGGVSLRLGWSSEARA